MTKTMQIQKQSKMVTIKTVTEDDELQRAAAVINELMKYESIYNSPSERDFKRFETLIKKNEMCHLFEIHDDTIHCVNGSVIRINKLILH